MSKESNKFWEPIIYKNGKLDEKQVLRELADFYIMMNEVPKVYDAVTGGLLSKPLYPAETVIDQFNNYIQKNYEDKDDVEIMVKEAADARDEKWIQWGESECPHSMSEKRRCFNCWQERKGEIGL